MGNTHGSYLRCCHERMRVNACVNKSLVQALKSSDVTPPSNLSTFSRKNSKSAGLVNAYMDSQKFNAILREPCSYYGSASVPKNDLRASNFCKFPGGACPQTP